MENKRSIGNAYEEEAAKYLQNRGYRIVDRNFYTKFGEIDIVALEGDFLCFVEVKYRKSRYAGNPLEAVNISKQRKISNSAKFYLMKHPRYRRFQMRFDVLGILGEEVRLIRNAFPYVGR